MTAVAASQRFTPKRRCPICDGCDRDPRGQERRCTGYTSSDGEYAHCTREDRAGEIKPSNASPPTFAHRLRGPCRCGVTHGEADVSGNIEYRYLDEHGILLRTVIRTPGKAFFQRAANGNHTLDGVRVTLYRLPELRAANANEPVLVVEGEKDCDAAHARGLLATCNPMGAGKWKAVAEHARQTLAGRNVVVIPDADEPGRKHAAEVVASLTGHVASVRLLELPGSGKDLSDWFSAGGTAAQLRELIGGTTPTEAPRNRWVVPLVDLLGDEEPDDDDSGDWIVRDIAPRGEPSMLHGPPKSGKTWFALDLAIDVALGRSWLDGNAENTMGGPARVLVLPLEDHERRLRRRVWELMRGRGMTPNDPTLRAHLSISRARVRIPDAGDLAAFASELKAWKPTLIIVDNITRTMIGDPNATRDAAAFSAAWGNLCIDTGAAVMFLHHSRKSNGERRDDDTLDGSRGSGDLVAAARHVMRLRPIGAEANHDIGVLTARGNLDIRVGERAIELVRTEHDGRMSARLIDRGEPAQVKRTMGVADVATRIIEAARSNPAGFENITQLAEGVRGKRTTVLAEIKSQLEPGGSLEYRGGRIHARTVPS